MAGSVNKVMLIGNVGRDPEIKVSKNGDSLATFSLATTYSYRPQGGERQDSTEWHRVVAWRNLAEQAQKYVTKGRKVFVEGRIQSRPYTDKNGLEKVAFEIVATQIEFLDSPQSGQRDNGEETPRTLVASGSLRGGKSGADDPFADLDDMPF